LYNDRWVLAQCKARVKIQHKSTEMRQHKAAEVADAAGTASEGSEILGACKAAIKKYFGKEHSSLRPQKPDI
jgi:hypothetical protein